MANYFSGFPQPQQFNQNYQQNNNSVIVVPVQGEQGAGVYPVAAGNTVFLFDFNQKKFWIKSTDINCLPSRFDAYTFEEEVKPLNQPNANFVPRNEFDAWKQSTDNTLKKILEHLDILTGGIDNVSNAK